jgi:hypothetical protein
MLSHWGPEEYEAQLGEGADDGLVNSIRNLDSPHSPRVVLIAERFDPEVILTADLLFQQHEVDIQCFQLSSDRINEEVFVSIQAHYPPPGLDDLYRSRARPTSPTKVKSQTWNDVKGWIEYEWGRGLIDYLRTLKDGDPGRRTFASMFPADGRGSPHVKFQKAEIRVDIVGRKEGDLALWREMLPSVDVGEWGQSDTLQGLTFKLRSADQAAEFLNGVGGDKTAVLPEVEVGQVAAATESTG